ncbi:MAG: hypothetical protein ABW080_03625 [Candidatus Thiodiazotropha sp.]
MMFIAGALTAGAIIIGVLYVEKDQRSLEPEELENVMRGYVETELRQLVQQIEYFFLLNNKYPLSLYELQKNNKRSDLVIDPYSRNAKCAQEYFYFVEANNSGYFLRSLGPDHKAFTDDDIEPDVEKEALGRIGLKLLWDYSSSIPKVKCYEWDKA